jgi:hypothetical protein
MNKREEIEFLRDMVKKLGTDSYTGPWLSGQLQAIECAILDDVCPSCFALDINAVKHHSEGLIKAANDQAQTVTAAAYALMEKAKEAEKMSYDRARRFINVVDNQKRAFVDALQSVM